MLDFLSTWPQARAQCLLAIESSTERLSVALGSFDPGQPLAQPQWQQEEAGGALASQRLLPLIRSLLDLSGITWPQLDAIVFGAGPGAFTGLRTACAVAQGLGFAHAIPLLGVPTVLAMAWQGWSAGATTAQRNAPARMQAVLDARMQALYVSDVDFARPQFWQAPIALIAIDELLAWQAAQGNAVPVISNASAVLEAHVLPTLHSGYPNAAAMWQLAPYMLAAGLAVPAAQALPLYIRNRVAQTTQERLTALRTADPSRRT